MANTAALEAEIERLRAKLAKKTALSLKVSEKGAISVYGLGRFPVTLYKEQFTRLLEHGPQIADFIAANEHLLRIKED